MRVKQSAHENNKAGRVREEISARVLLYCFHAHSALLARASLLLLFPMHHDSGSSYLFTTFVASWLATVLLELIWGFNGTFTD